MKHLFAIIILSCLYLHKTSAQEIKLPDNKMGYYEQEPPKIAIVSLKIMHTENTDSVALIDAMILNTSKNIPELPRAWRENDFVGFLLDDQKQILDTFTIESPLKVRFESPNENGTITSNTIELASNEIVCRFKYTSLMKHLRIAKAGKDADLTIIGTFDLPSTH